MATVLRYVGYDSQHVMLRGASFKQKCARSRIDTLISHYDGPGNILVKRGTPTLGPPPRTPRQSIRVERGTQFVQRTRVHAPFEIDDVINRTPELNPAYPVEFRFITTIEADPGIVSDQPQHEPALFLSDTEGPAVAANEFVWQPVSQPVTAYAEHLDIGRFKADFFVQLTKHRIDGVLAFQHATLRKLPALGAYPTTKQELVVSIRKDDADIGAKPIGVNPIVAHSNRTKTQTTVYFTLSIAYRPRRFFVFTGRNGILLVGLLLLAAGALMVALASGSADVGFSEMLGALRGEATPQVRSLVVELRLPRAMTAFAVGGLLAVAGVLMQVLLRNPLAEPYILGSSGGAAVAALLAMLFGMGAAVVDLSAFAGAMAATLLVFSIAHGTGSWTPTRLLLTGVVLAAGFSAATTLILALTPDQNLRGMLFWLMGDLSFAYEPARALLLLGVLIIGGTLGARHLNVLSRGELQAAILGLPVPAFRYIIFVAAAMATALAVTTAGVIGFLGLVVPHLVRLVAGSDHRLVLPASAIAGGALLVVADTMARTLMAPRQLPVGALTAAIGVPLFLILMSRARQSRYR